MRGRDLAWRVGGVLAVAVAGGLSIFQRSVVITHGNGSASTFEFVIGLVSFALAGLGVLLMTQGAALRDSWIRACNVRQCARISGEAPEASVGNERAWTTAIAADPFAMAGGRAAIAMLLADRAIRAAAADRAKASFPTDTRKQEIPRDRTRLALRDSYLPLARRRGDSGSL